MEKFNKIIDSSNIADGSKALYKRQIKKLYEKLSKKTHNIKRCTLDPKDYTCRRDLYE
jgi:ribonuclease HIII